MDVAGQSREFLLKEYEHIAESLLNNEQSGETRVNIFLALAGGITAAFGLSDKPLFTGSPEPVAIIVLIFIGVIGSFTLLRLVDRNIVTDDFKRKLARIRFYFAQKD